MARVTGIGGVFLRARDPERLNEWYADHLGLDLEDWSGVVFRAQEGDVTVWYASELSDGPAEQAMMINYRVDDLDAILARLRAAGVEVLDEVVDGEQGRFGWAVDPEGNRFELWQPS